MKPDETAGNKSTVSGKEREEIEAIVRQTMAQYAPEVIPPVLESMGFKPTPRSTADKVKSAVAVVLVAGTAGFIGGTIANWRERRRNRKLAEAKQLEESASVELPNGRGRTSVRTQLSSPN